MDPDVISQQNKAHKSELVSLICNNEGPFYAGEKFLRLAAALQTFGDIEQRGHILYAMLHATARLVEQAPLVEELNTVLEKLEGDLDLTFSELVTQCQQVMGGSEQPPSFESFLVLVDSLPPGAKYTGCSLDIPASEYAVWSVAFVEWCFGMKPSIKKGEEIVRDIRSTTLVVNIV